MERRPDGAGNEGSTRFRWHGGNVGAQDKRYAVYVQAEREIVPGSATVTLGSRVVLVTNVANYTLDKVYAFSGVVGPRRVTALTPAGSPVNSIQIDIPADGNQSNLQVRRRILNAADALVRFESNVGTSPDPYVPGSARAYTEFAEIGKAQRFFFNLEHQIRQVLNGGTRPMEYFDNPDAKSPRHYLSREGRLLWGDGATDEADTSLFRDAAGRMAISTRNNVSGDLIATDFFQGGLAPDVNLVPASGIIDFQGKAVAVVFATSGVISGVENVPVGRPFYLIFRAYGTTLQATLNFRFFPAVSGAPSGAAAPVTGTVLGFISSGINVYQISRSDSTKTS